MTSPAIDSGKRVALAAVAGAHGIKGEVRLKLFSDSVDGLARHPRLFVAGREMAVQSIKGGPKAAIARFEGVNDRAAAEGLRGSLVEVIAPRCHRSNMANFIMLTSSGCRA